ncbi:STN domain-containing protein [Bradyrhizobium sp. 2TAF24]|uniref:STN domain-containing protein n=1 Tax=Bradyrhizobium sp. 2TAF24 TaxID=3233011 RepID=UPI003F905CEB
MLVMWCAVSARSVDWSAVLRAAGKTMIATVACMSFVHAQPASVNSELQFDIPSQPLDSALESYMQVTGLQVLYASALTAARISARVEGRRWPHDALDELLVGTGLAARTTADGAFTLVVVARPRAVPSRQVVGFENYLGHVQDRIIAALCRQATTRPGSYRIALQFSIGIAGTIRDAALLGPSGDNARDEAITVALRGLPVGQAAPRDMPQPVTMLISPSAATGRNECRGATP